MPRSVESNDSGWPTGPDKKAWRHFGDGYAGELHAARIQGYDSSTLGYVDVAVDSNGNLKLAADVSVDLGTVDQGAAGASPWKVTDAALVALTDGSLRVGGTVAVSAAALPLPAGAAKDSTLTDGSQRVGGTVAVSIASMPSTPVTGPLTDTQLRASAVPVSLAALPALAASSAVIGHVIVDTAPSQAADQAAALPSVLTVIGGWDGLQVRSLTARIKDGVNMLEVADQQSRRELESIHLLMVETNDLLRQLVGERADVI